MCDRHPKRIRDCIVRCKFAKSARKGGNQKITQWTNTLTSGNPANDAIAAAEAGDEALVQEADGPGTLHPSWSNATPHDSAKPRTTFFADSPLHLLERD